MCITSPNNFLGFSQYLRSEIQIIKFVLGFLSLKQFYFLRSLLAVFHQEFFCLLVALVAIHISGWVEGGLANFFTHFFRSDFL